LKGKQKVIIARIKAPKAKKSQLINRIYRYNPELPGWEERLKESKFENRILAQREFHFYGII